MTTPTATVLLSCPDQKGLVARLAQFIYGHGGNIIHADHHTDFSAGVFLTRIEWQLDEFDLSRDEIAPAFDALVRPLSPIWDLHFSDTVRRMSIWASLQDHCLVDLIWRQRAGEFQAEIPVIVSNHPGLAGVAENSGIEFQHIPTPHGHTADVEARHLDLMRRHSIDLIVLAKYMQVLGNGLLEGFPRIINIHHSFLPAFGGAQPYRQAHERGVKIIGATAHYVTGDLDAGPIIEQDVTRISHRDEVADLMRKGKDLERVVLARAVRLHLQNRVLSYGNRTVVFA